MQVPRRVGRLQEDGLAVVLNDKWDGPGVSVDLHDEDLLVRPCMVLDDRLILFGHVEFGDPFEGYPSTSAKALILLFAPPYHTYDYYIPYVMSIATFGKKATAQPDRPCHEAPRDGSLANAFIRATDSTGSNALTLPL